MSNDMSKKVIDIIGVELTPGEPAGSLATASRALNVVATSATTICFVSLSLILKMTRATKGTLTLAIIFRRPNKPSLVKEGGTAKL